MNRLRLSSRQMPLAATCLVCLLLYLAVSIAFPRFHTVAVFVNLLTDNAFLGAAAVGMTFVILTGGIDLSVGAVVGCSSVFIASMIGKGGHPPIPVLIETLAFGAMFGAAMGVLIHHFELPAFLVTLAGMFLARGAGLVLSMESIPIDHPQMVKLSGSDSPLPVTAMLFLALLVVAIWLAQWVKFGRDVYAVGGDKTSALLMGLPVGRTTILVYAFSGFCSALAGVIYSLYTLSGNATAGQGLELDAIAAAVIGGTLLSGGVGYVFGTLIGVLILGIIQTAITFQGELSSWWIRIAIGLLLLAFILLQRFLQSGAARSSDRS